MPKPRPRLRDTKKWSRYIKRTVVERVRGRTEREATKRAFRVVNKITADTAIGLGGYNKKLSSQKLRRLGKLTKTFLQVLNEANRIYREKGEASRDKYFNEEIKKCLPMISKIIGPRNAKKHLDIIRDLCYVLEETIWRPPNR